MNKNTFRTYATKRGFDARYSGNERKWFLTPERSEKFISNLMNIAIKGNIHNIINAKTSKA